MGNKNEAVERFDAVCAAGDVWSGAAAAAQAQIDLMNLRPPHPTRARVCEDRPMTASDLRPVAACNVRRVLDGEPALTNRELRNKPCNAYCDTTCAHNGVRYTAEGQAVHAEWADTQPVPLDEARELELDRRDSAWFWGVMSACMLLIGLAAGLAVGWVRGWFQ